MNLLRQILTRTVIGMIVMPLASASHAQNSSAEKSSVEFQIKGAFLYKMGAFVTWPKESFSSSNAPFELCLLGDDPFGVELDKAVQDERVSGRAIEIKRVKISEALIGCHILYIGEATDDQISKALRAVASTPILTATDGRPTSSGGIINFVLKDKRVRFEIDDKMAAQSGLMISSRLLTLAVSVRPRS